MKKSTLIFLPFAVLANAILLSLGMECFLYLLSSFMAVSLDSTLSYPRFIPFCIVLGIAALLGLSAMLMLNIRVSEKLKFTKSVWLWEYIVAFVLSIPMLKLWEMLFDFLQKTV